MNDETLQPHEDLMLRALSGEISSQERDELQAIMKNDPVATKTFADLQTTWNELADLEILDSTKTTNSQEGRATDMKKQDEVDYNENLSKKVMTAIHKELPSQSPNATEPSKTPKNYPKPKTIKSNKRQWLPLLMEAAMLLLIPALIYYAIYGNKTDSPEKPEIGKKDKSPNDPDIIKKEVVSPTKVKAFPLAFDSENENLIIKEKLQRKISFEFVDTPLNEALAFLSALARVTFIIDPTITSTPSINLRVTDMNMELSLEWILKLADLHFEIRNGAVFITKGSQIISNSSQISLYQAPNIPPPLKKKVSLEFSQTPVSEAIKMLKQLTKLSIKLDGIKTHNHPLTFRVTDMRIDNLLQWIAVFTGRQVTHTMDGGITLFVNRKQQQISTKKYIVKKNSSLKERLNQKVLFSADRISRGALLSLLTRDAGLPLDSSGLSNLALTETLQIGYGHSTIYNLLAHAVLTRIDVPLKAEWINQKITIREKSIDDLLDQQTKLRKIKENTVDQDQHLASTWVNNLATTELFLTPEFKGITKQQTNIKIRQDPTGKTNRTILQEVCNAVGWAYEIKGKKLTITNKPQPKEPDSEF